MFQNMSGLWRSVQKVVISGRRREREVEDGCFPVFKCAIKQD